MKASPCEPLTTQHIDREKISVYYRAVMTVDAKRIRKNQIARKIDRLDDRGINPPDKSPNSQPDQLDRVLEAD
jgi:hypothetical protein